MVLLFTICLVGISCGWFYVLRYHVVRGRKRFYIIPPSVINFQKYVKWAADASQEITFLGHMTGDCQVLEVCAGQTLLLPGGWLHAVYTPEDSLVFGGNFLLSSGVYRQLQVTQIEHLTKVRRAFQLPLQRQLSWYALTALLPAAAAVFATDTSGEGTKALVQRDLFLTGAAVTIAQLRQWSVLVRVHTLWLTAEQTKSTLCEEDRVSRHTHRHIYLPVECAFCSR